MRGVRGALPSAACAERSSALVARLEALPLLASARSAALFWPMADRREVDLRALDASLRARGAAVAYPRTDATGAMAFHVVSDVDAMDEHPRGFREPKVEWAEIAPGDLDVICVPALAIDPRGHRIGYGGGHYDRVLPRQPSPERRVAVVFDFQLVAEVPNTPGDVPVGVIVTDRRTLVAETA